MLTLTIIGSNSALPAHGRHPTSQVVQLNDHYFLVDCGEGTQMRMSEFKVKPHRINHVFISHLHGDHYFGLVGLLTSMGLTQRSNPLYIFSPPGLKELIELHFKISQGRLPYELIFSELMEESVLFEDDQSLVECFKVMHRIDCWGFVFREKKNPRKIDPEKVHSHKVPVFFYHDLQHGEDYLAADGSLIPNEELTDTNDPPRSYAYCGDTGYYPPIVEKVKNVDLLYHEATYLHALEEKAVSRFHSTAAQAALIAKQANAKKLLIGHYSSIYSDPEVLQAEAASIFPNTECAREGTCIHV